MNWEILFKNMLRLLEFRIDKSRLFHSITEEEKKRIFEKKCLLYEKGVNCYTILCCKE